VTSNQPLSADYNVLSLAAPDIAAAAAPGQFVMVKAGAGPLFNDPLLRRPFSVFEVLRDARGEAAGISLLNKRIGPSTNLLYGARRAAELFYLDFFRQRGVDLVLTTEDGTAGERGRIVEPLERALASRPTAAPLMINACGPEGMLAAAARVAARHGRRCQ